MAVANHQLVEAWRQVLTLSGVQPGQMITILTSQDTHPQTLSTAKQAVADIGATQVQIDLLPVNAEKALSRDALAYLGTTPLTNNPAAYAALQASDLVLDLMTLLFSPEQHEILQSGTKILLAAEPPEVLVRMVPTKEDKERVERSARVLEGAKEVRALSQAGTDLIMPIGQYPVMKEYGFVDEPGRWDHWPSGFVLTWPDEDKSYGRVVLDRGDILLPMKKYVTEPIEMMIEKGFVTSITGGLDAELLNEYMASFDDPDAYAMSHIGWGLQPRAYWSTLSLYDREQTIGMDARAFSGNFLFSFGPNNEVGGSRATACHIDIPMRNCTVLVDGREVVLEGKVIKELA
ncbi:2,5-dihydroxypyridine 5,6-dioxygenase [Paenalcaligenes niemegkensis]|uniref:2,5-dihydroxypyridine 5,6-dioxygenase n=1 Tax=Paenalcaligenes niemegkensis TaxID=2895469 RepID=UPI001EE85A55|nr:2,5-dihydroxypyridine 5,6-dioxygenase [Paenalcaligenes niemegkensis]MCQ9617650.1 2,5-dihydroxypyridine 5,6-dioxygenase [Paenalcaligenes niemegkensis]